MAIGYRAVLSAEYTEQNLARTVDVLRKWVTWKKGFCALPSGGVALKNADAATLVADEFSEEDRGVSGHRWTLVEQWAPPPWYNNSETDRTGVTRITLVFSSGLMWLWVDVEPPTLEYIDSAGRDRLETQPSGTPAFVSDIFNRVEMHDGLEMPVPEIQNIVNDNHIEELLNVLRDTGRRGAVYVTSPPEDTSDIEWQERTSKILGRIEGMGFSYLLTSGARSAFNSVVAAGHRIPAGSMRTFLPGADLDNAKDSLRHRLLHASTIRESTDRRLQRIIRNAQIKRLRDLQLPDPLRDADYAFLRDKGLQTFEILRNADSVVAEQPTADRTAELLKRLGEAEELLNVALEENESLRMAVRSARKAAIALQDENDEAYIDIAVLRRDTEKDHRVIEHFQRELSQLGAAGATAAYGYVDNEEDEYPSTFRELIACLGDLGGIRYFGDSHDAEDLDEYSDLGDAAIMKAWDAIVTFNTYANARKEGRFEHSLSQYINNTQHGLPMRIAKVKWGEGETVRTNAKMVAQRTVTGLPESIDPSGAKALVAHIALATGRAGSPRMYFEDTVAAAGFVTIGYIGAHLDNTLTN